VAANTSESSREGLTTTSSDRTTTPGPTMMHVHIDLDADVGEGLEAADRAILPLISSANIACGGHAGDARSVARTVELAIRHVVGIGAHPGYPDREGFGRRHIDISRIAAADSLDLASLPMLPGAVRLPTNGQPIMLMPDTPTVGGYPVPAVVAEVDRPITGQLRPGDELRFDWTGLETARERARRQRTRLRDLAVAMA